MKKEERREKSSCGLAVAVWALDERLIQARHTHPSIRSATHTVSHIARNPRPRHTSQLPRASPRTKPPKKSETSQRRRCARKQRALPCPPPPASQAHDVTCRSTQSAHGVPLIGTPNRHPLPTPTLPRTRDTHTASRHHELPGLFFRAALAAQAESAAAKQGLARSSCSWAPRTSTVRCALGGRRRSQRAEMVKACGLMATLFVQLFVL